VRKKHQPPSRARYAASHPTIGIHVTREERELLRTLTENTGLSATQLTKQALGILKADLEAVRKKCLQEGMRRGKVAGRTEGYTEGHNDGYAEAKARYGVPYTCTKCGGEILMHAGKPSAIRAATMLRDAGWGHIDCPEPE
jgi:hypothetical protein